MKTRSLALLLTVVLSLAGCTSDEPSPTTTTQPAPGPVTTTVPPGDPGSEIELVAGCGGIDLPTRPAVVLPDTELDGDAQAALERAGEVLGAEAGFFSGYDWSIASRNSDRMQLFGRSINPVRPGDPPYASASFELKDGVWEPAGWGQCRVEVDAPGFGNALWVLDGQPDPEATELPIQINERNCASGQPPVGREIVPVITSEVDRITITILVEPVQGGAACPSNPWFPVTVELGEALGDRTLYDGAMVPALERPWPPTPSSIDSLGSEE